MKLELDLDEDYNFPFRTFKDKNDEFENSSGSSFFEPQSERSDQTPSERSRIIPPKSAGWPEKKLTLFALHLAIIEKTASSLGQLAFLWATVVLLGGFASDLKPIDFWFVTAILLVQTARLFSRSGELEWQHQPNRTSAVAIDFVSRNISRFLYWMQIISAATCVALSVVPLGQQQYGVGAQMNEESALNVFYCLALAEALMFLSEKGYWSWTIEHGKLLERVCDECNLDDSDVVSLRRFFYDAYSKCINGSIFDGLKMNLIAFAEGLLHSDSLDQQIIGGRMLQRFVENERFASDTLRRIGSSAPVIERLIEMLNWKDIEEKEIRRSASNVLLRLASRKQHALRVAAIPGAMESIASLLQTGGGNTGERPYEAATPRAVVIVDMEENEFSAFNLIGLLILKRLAKEHDNCWKIGNTRGLLARIINLTSTGATLLIEESQINMVRRALQVVKILVCATGETGRIIRRDISEIVYSVSNISELLQNGARHLKLQMLGMKIVTSLGMNEEAREKIGATGSMLGLILATFFRRIESQAVAALCNEAGEALAMLILESRINCERMLREEANVVEKLIDALGHPALAVCAARILSGLCAYSALERSDRLQIVAKAMPLVLRTIMKEKKRPKKKEREKLLELSIGLAQQILKLKDLDCGREFQRAGIKEEDFIKRLVEILAEYKNPESKVPRMRRFVTELAITLMKYEQKYIELFRDFGMEQVLMRTAETTAELECFNVFSGSVGLGRLEAMISLVDRALKLLTRKIYNVPTPVQFNGDLTLTELVLTHSTHDVPYHFKFNNPIMHLDQLEFYVPFHT